jgi:DNA-binding NtrC family response regulator
VPVLVEFFLRNLATARAAAGISPAAMTLLREYSWPGNVRELRLVMEQLVGTAPGIVAEVDDLPARIRLGRRRAGLGAAAR